MKIWALVYDWCEVYVAGDERVLGIYSDEEKALDALERAEQCGAWFLDHNNVLKLVEHEIDEDWEPFEKEVGWPF